MYLTSRTFDPTLNGGSWVVTPTTQFIGGVPLEFSPLRRFDEDKRIRSDGDFVRDDPVIEKRLILMRRRAITLEISVTCQPEGATQALQGRSFGVH